VIKYRSGLKYQLAEDYICQLATIRPDTFIKSDYIELDKQGFLLIRKGYAWDGCSGPTKDTLSNMRAGLVHDALYQLMRERLLDSRYRKEADLELASNFKDAGYMIYKNALMRRFVDLRSKVFYDAVRAAAGFAVDPKNRKVIHTAP